MEALRHSITDQNIDEEIQKLFAQLFVLRNVEDRKLASRVPPLRSVLSDQEEINRVKLDEIFRLAKRHIGSELFDRNVSNNISNYVVSGIIEDLYVPKNLPDPNARYNFSWLDSDVLGSAYEKYLSTILVPTKLPPQLVLFHQPKRDVARLTVRRAGGIYYTPNFLTRYLSQKCLDSYFEGKNGLEIPCIADFACGSGSFLVSAIDILLRRLRQADPHKNWASEIIEKRKIIGIDIDERAITMARLNLWQRLTEEPDPLPLPDLSKVIVHGDSLGKEVWKSLPRKYDVILGNPPFIATGRLQGRDAAMLRFRTAQGRFDYSYLFVELAISLLKVDGVLGMVVPNRLFRNRDANTIRDILTKETDLLTVIDFGSLEVFENTSAYVGCVVARKYGARSKRSSRVRVINVRELTGGFVAAELLKADDSKNGSLTKRLEAYSAAHPQGELPWVLLSDAKKLSRSKLEERSEPLGSIAGIFQGIRTGANDIFIVQPLSGEVGGLIEVLNGLGDTAIVESGILQPVVYGSDVRRYDNIVSEKFLIFPYRAGRLIAERDFRSNFPKGFDYLDRYREILTSRGSISPARLQWYELVRKRDEDWLRRPKLLIRDLANRTAFALDEEGGTFLVGGTAVVPEDPNFLLALLAFLNGNIVNEYLKEITPSFRSGFQKFEPQHLQKIPIPHKLLNDMAFVARLTIRARKVLDAHLEGDLERQSEIEDDVNEFLAKELDV